MSKLIETLIKLLKTFNEKGVKYCVIGGLALNFYGIMRKTEDIDLFIDPDSANLEKVIASLIEIFQDEELKRLKTSDFMEYSVVRYGTPEGFSMDLITKSGETISWSKLESQIEWRNIGDLRVPLPRVEMLIRMKEGASLFRERDRADLYYLYRLKDLGEKGFQ